MRIGKLNQRVEIQRKTTTVNPAGESVDTWATIKTVWATIRRASGNETIIGEQLKNKDAYAIIIRYYDGLTTKDRLLWKDS